jgi:hypothetical protein
VKYWEIIADNLSKASWSWGCVATVDRDGRTIFVADAHRGDGQRFVVRADEKLTAFYGIRIGDFAYQARPYMKLGLDNAHGSYMDGARQTDLESGGGHFPAGFFASSRPATTKNQTQRGKKKRRTPKI